MSSSFLRLYKGSAGYCSMYRGEVCRGLLRRSALVFFNSSLPEPEQAQEFLANGGWAELEGTSPLCQPAARSLLCHAAFLDCSPTGLGPTPKPVCRYTAKSHRFSANLEKLRNSYKAETPMIHLFPYSGLKILYTALKPTVSYIQPWYIFRTILENFKLIFWLIANNLMMYRSFI